MIARCLDVHQSGKLSFMSTSRQLAHVPMQKPEQEVRQPLRHDDHKVQPTSKPVKALQEFGFLRQFPLDRLLHTFAQEFRPVRSIEEPVAFAGNVESPNATSVHWFPVRDRQQPKRVVFEYGAVTVDAFQN